MLSKLKWDMLKKWNIMGKRKFGSPPFLSPPPMSVFLRTCMCVCERNDKGRKWIACFYCSIRHRHVKEVIDGTEERESVCGRDGERKADIRNSAEQKRKERDEDERTEHNGLLLCSTTLISLSLPVDDLTFLCVCVCLFVYLLAAEHTVANFPISTPPPTKKKTQKRN